MGVIRQSEAPYFLPPRLVNANPVEGDHKVLQINYIGPQIESVLDYQPEEGIDIESWSSHIHPEDRNSVRNTAGEPAWRWSRAKVKWETNVS